ncbi:highly acidic protein [Campylobacter upsaliensis]|uniref:highly acidic protein n=1 Tax=Campylobacter upsaliensis TaxID=28080 RepID=UPI002149A1B4|nr:highly acidic protein [Campylobacter upsaliensis]MCR2103006.1 highly acidic protein [Campylobacter upsaliensis]
MSWNDEEENFEEFDDEEEVSNSHNSYNYDEEEVSNSHNSYNYDEDDYEFDDENDDEFYEID